MLRRLHQLGGYVFWSAAGVMLPLAVDRLIVHPALNESLGAEAFGGLIWALGLITMVGSVAGNGFAILLMRDAAKLDPDGKRRAFSTSLLLTTAITPLLLAVAVILSLPVATQAVQDNKWAIYLTLCGFALFRTLEINLNANLRIQRRFRAIFILRVIESATLSANLLFLTHASFWIIGGVYLASSVLPLATNLYFSRDVVGFRDAAHPATARWLLAGWFAGAMITLLDQSQVYLSRILLGVLTDGVQVAYFYAGVAMGNIFVLPVRVIGSVVLSMLGGRNSYALPGLKSVYYYLASVVTGVGVGGLAWFVGGWLVTNRYPDLAEETLSFYGWIALACGSKATFSLLRPIAIKYAPLWVTTTLIAATLLLQIVLLTIWAAADGAAGAAKALGVSGLIATTCWSVYFGWVGLKQTTLYHEQQVTS